MEGQADPVVGDPRLGEIVGSDPLASFPGSNLAPAVGRDLGLLLLLSLFQKARAQHPHRLRPVFQLGALVLAGDHEAGWEMSDPHRRIGRVDPLTTRPGRTVDIHAEVFLGHSDVHIFSFRENRDGHG